jgi:thiamine-phosphate pyrophosphorylase
MPHRHPIPRVWLVTDERQGDRLLDAVARLPTQAGILFRHYSLGRAERRKLFDEVRDRAGDTLMMLAGPERLAAEWGADGWHGWGEGCGLRSASVHDLSELRRAEAEGADLVFVSPVFPTRSHPGAGTLGVQGFEALARMARPPVIALGGVTAANAAELLRHGAHGWAAVDAWLEDERPA